MVNSSGISFSGLASGLDTQAIVQQLLALERIPIQLLENKKQTEQNKLDKLGSFEAKLKALQSKADELATTDGFFAWAVQNTDPSVATINATGGAQAGVHTLEVLELAAVDRWAFDAVLDPSAELATADGQQLVFEVGATQYSLTVNQSESSLDDIASAIEDMAGDDVNAEVINTGTAGNPQYRLVLSSGEAGEDNRISNIVTDIPGLGISYTPPDANGDPTSANNLTVGSNAQVLIDDLPVERTTNDLSDVFEGLEINLLSTTEIGEQITFSVEADKEAIRESIDAFIAGYNDVVGFINQQSTFTPAEEEGEAGTSGELFGDPILSSVRSAMSRALFYADFDDVANDTEGYSTLSLVGIKQGNDGTLSIDEAVFDEKIADNLNLFADLFVDSDGFDNGDAEPNTNEFYTDTTADSGLAATLSREIERMFGTYEGPIDPDTGDRVVFDALFGLKEDTIRDSMKRYDGQIETMERRLETFERNLVLRFARLEELMAGLNAQGAALSNAFA